MGPPRSQNGRQQTHVSCPPVAERENCYSILSCSSVGRTEVKLRAQRPTRAGAGWGRPGMFTGTLPALESSRPVAAREGTTVLPGGPGNRRARGDTEAQTGGATGPGSHGEVTAVAESSHPPRRAPLPGPRLTQLGALLRGDGLLAVGLAGHGAGDAAFAPPLAVGGLPASGGHGLLLIVVLPGRVVRLLPGGQRGRQGRPRLSRGTGRGREAWPLELVGTGWQRPTTSSSKRGDAGWEVTGWLLGSLSGTWAGGSSRGLFYAPSREMPSALCLQDYWINRMGCRLAAIKATLLPKAMFPAGLCERPLPSALLGAGAPWGRRQRKFAAGLMQAERGSVGAWDLSTRSRAPLWSRLGASPRGL